MPRRCSSATKSGPGPLPQQRSTLNTRRCDGLVAGEGEDEIRGRWDSLRRSSASINGRRITALETPWRAVLPPRLQGQPCWGPPPCACGGKPKRARSRAIANQVRRWRGGLAGTASRRVVRVNPPSTPDMRSTGASTDKTEPAMPNDALNFLTPSTKGHHQHRGLPPHRRRARGLLQPQRSPDCRTPPTLGRAGRRRDSGPASWRPSKPLDRRSARKQAAAVAACGSRQPAGDHPALASPQRGMLGPAIVWQDRPHAAGLCAD